MAHPSASSTSWVVGVDVGTSSARAGVIEIATGRLLASHSHPILLFHPQADFYQHSSADIWAAVCTATTSALQLAHQRQPSFSPSAIRAIAFDATCSLVLLGAEDAPVSVSPGGEVEQNVIVWMDHRAQAEAAAINGSGHEVLRYVGGQVSVEMEVPKLLWLKRHMPDSFHAATRFLDLCDFLSYKATGSDGQSSTHAGAAEMATVAAAAAW